MQPIKVSSDFRIIAHRGASAYAPENTLPAFSMTKEMGIMEVELDTQLSSDGVVVVCHDKSLNRYKHDYKDIEKISSKILLKLDMGSWFSPDFTGTCMVSLEQLFAEFGRSLVYHIELKGEAENLPRSVYELVYKTGLLDRTIFTSFSFEQLHRMRKVSADCRLGWLVNSESFDDNIMRKSEELKLFQLCPRADLLTKEMVQHARSVVSDTRAWGVQGEPNCVRMLIHRIVNSGCGGMTINWPDWVVQ